MKSKLSALKYVINNKKQVWVMIVALALTFMTMYTVNFILLSTQESFNTVMHELPKKIGYVNPTVITLGVDPNDYEDEDAFNEAVRQARNEVVEKLKAHEGIDDAYYSQVNFAPYNALVGDMGFEVPMVEPDMIQGYLDHMGAELVEGRMPSGDGEFLVDEVILKNQKLHVGDYYNQNSFGETFKVVGALSSDCLATIGTPRGYSNRGFAFVVYCNEENADMKKLFSDIGIILTDSDEIDDVVTWGEAYDTQVKDTIDVSLLGILLVVVVFLSISIIVAYISFMRNRVNEYCLYTSIGFGRREVYGMTMREIGIIFLVSLGLGALLACIIIPVLAAVLLEPAGLAYKFFYPKHILRILASFAAIVGILQIPIIVTIHSIKTIDKIEE